MVHESKFELRHYPASAKRSASPSFQLDPHRNHTCRLRGDRRHAPARQRGLAGVDEERTLARLRGLRSDLIDPTIAVRNGRVVKRTGDGSLIEFRSVVDAVRCAIEVQNGMAERNAGVSPEKRIEFRVGIHLGDVVEESDGDLMGDGVNIAARLQGVAKPGAICLSEQAYWQVKGRLDLAVSSGVRETPIKMINASAKIFRCAVEAEARERST